MRWLSWKRKGGKVPGDAGDGDAGAGVPTPHNDVVRARARLNGNTMRRTTRAREQHQTTGERSPGNTQSQASHSGVRTSAGTSSRRELRAGKSWERDVAESIGTFAPSTMAASGFLGVSVCVRVCASTFQSAVLGGIMSCAGLKWVGGSAAVGAATFPLTVCSMC